MKAAVFHGAGDLRVEEVAEPAGAPHEVVVEVELCGICGSDLHSYRHGALVEPGQIMGHEFSGRVVGVGSEVEGVELGERVTAMNILPCGECGRCASGHYNRCPSAWRNAIACGRPGGFAERVGVPHAAYEKNLFRLDGVDDVAGATVEPLAVAVHAVRTVGEVAGKTVIVLGLGMIGQEVSQALLANDAGRVIGVDLSAPRLAAARELGVEAHDGSPGMRDILKAALAPGEQVELIFECSGVPSLLAGTLRSVAAGGTVCALALYGGTVEIDPLRLVQKEILLRGAFGFVSEDFSAAVALLREGRAQAAPLISETLPLAEISAAFEAQLARDAAPKILIAPNA